MFGQQEIDEQQAQNVHTVCFVISNDANLECTADGFTRADGVYASSLRGEFAVGWSVPAAFCDVVSPVLTYLNHTATENDDFLLQLPILSYTNSTAWQHTAMQPLAEQMSGAMERMGLSYVQFSKNCGPETETLRLIAEQSLVKGLISLDPFEPSFAGGEIVWIAEKPAVSARYHLTADDSVSTLEAMVSNLNGASTDPTVQDAYSVVVIDANVGLNEQGDLVEGGDPMTVLALLTASLEQQVQVVTVSELMSRIDTCLAS